MTETLLQIVEQIYSDIDETLAKDDASDNNVSGITYGFVAYAVADLPISVSSFQVAYASNGRKAGETAGNGTGVPVWFNAATNQWVTFYDNSAVQA